MRLIERIRAFVIRVRGGLSPTPAAWRGAGTGIVLLSAAIAAFLFASYFLPDFAWQKLPAYVVSTGALMLAGAAALLLLNLLNRSGAFFRVALFVFAPIVLTGLVPGESHVALMAGGAMVVTAALLGGGGAVLRASGWRFASHKSATLALLSGVLLLAGGLYATFSTIDDPNPWLENYELADRTLPLPNPAQPGDYDVLTLTYGSGEDRRPEYGENVTLTSRRVDGSKLIDNWDGLTGWLRTSYWGFDAQALPLQARAWYPDGDGPFPLVLIVHGNHSMEDYSDPGYAWLGELLASRGIILASVDENFLNSSVSAWVDVFADRPGLEEENDARGWLLLEHLALWRDWNRDAEHPFAGKVDMSRVALIGHSRGGEAVGIAAAFNALSHYPDDATLEFDYGFDLRGVIAIAPVDGQYEPREKPTPIRNVNYFTIHGSMDGDVQSFDGTAQYARVRFDDDAGFHFRSSLFVEGANHGQFNTTWENLDTGRFRAWALDLDRIMPAEDQRDIARVYFSAFLEIVLRDRYDYLPVFRDARHAAGWLPTRYLINQYSDSRTQTLADFEEDIDPGTTSRAGGTIAAHNTSKWYETANSIKYDALDTHAAVFAWDDRHSSEPGRVEFRWPRLSAPPGSHLVLSLSQADTGTMPKDWEPPEEVESENADDETGDSDDPAGIDFTVTVRDASGNTASLPLSHDALLHPLVASIPRRASFLEFDEPTEVLFRRFSLPLDDFAAQGGGGFDPTTLTGIDLVFDRSARGAMIIDDVSLAPAPSGPQPLP